jgi:hypothetical protein
MSEEIELAGVHGTSVTRTQSIQKNGFRKSLGRLGEGVYFWSDNPFAEYLAKAWWEFESSRNAYKDDENPNCSTIQASFQIEENDYLNLDERDIKNALAQLCIDQKLGYSANSKEMAATVMAFVERLEKKMDHKFKVMESTVSTAPKRFVDRYPVALLGAPSCCIVFDETCIKILKVGICS